MRKRSYDIGWSNEKKCRDCHKGEVPRSTDFTTARVGTKSTVRSQRNSEMGAKIKNIKEGNGSGKEASLTHPPSESQWSKKPAKCEEIGSLRRVAEKWRACGWSVVQLYQDEELGPMHGMCGALEAEHEVYRTIKRAELPELTAFLCFFKKIIGRTNAHVDNKWILDGLWKGEVKCTGPKAAAVGLCTKMCEEMHHRRSKEILNEVEHVKAHRTKRDKKEMSKVEKFIVQGIEKVDEVAKEGATLDEGFVAESRARTVQQEPLQYAASFHCLVKEWKDCEEFEPKPSRFSWILQERRRSIDA